MKKSKKEDKSDYKTADKSEKKEVVSEKKKTDKKK